MAEQETIKKETKNEEAATLTPAPAPGKQDKIEKARIHKDDPDVDDTLLEEEEMLAVESGGQLLGPGEDPGPGKILIHGLPHAE